RKSLSYEERARIDTLIAKHVVATAEWCNSALILTYLSVDKEVDTRELIEYAWQAGKTVAIPRVIPHTRLMDWYRIQDFNQLEKSKFGILEPLADPKNLIRLSDEDVFGIPSLAVVPGLSFDLAGYRMGYGGGFYDSLLASFAGYSVGLCREIQLCDSLADLGVIDIHDQAVELVVSEQQTIRAHA
ncbi:5-formyltetrahydrofolate cyclo-ligase, partial [uncultured Olegusella sp.]|uniref:5-formyltetrahydrofolate cyclo-ligase n=1 Tax=uncultured Olegusella sp. TaxID=1979846 RepID=UPI00261AB7B0